MVCLVMARITPAVIDAFNRNLQSGNYDRSITRGAGGMVLDDISYVIKEYNRSAPPVWTDRPAGNNGANQRVLIDDLTRRLRAQPQYQLGIQDLIKIISHLREIAENPLRDNIVNHSLHIDGFLILCEMADRTGRLTTAMDFVVEAVHQAGNTCEGWSYKDVQNYFKPGVGLYLTNLLLRCLLDHGRSVPADIVNWAMRLHDQKDFADENKKPRIIAPGSTAFEVMQWVTNHMYDDDNLPRMVN